MSRGRDGIVRLLPASPALRPWVAGYWHSSPAVAIGATTREWVLPDGHAHLALRLDGTPLRRWVGGEVDARVISDAVLAGPHSRAYLKEVVPGTASVGVVFRPGALRALFGMAAAELVDCHVALEDVWGQEVAALRERLQAGTPALRLSLLEAGLLARLRPSHGLHPQVAARLGQVEDGARIAEIARAAGYSARRFTDLFHEGVGMTPRRYANLRRFARVLPSAAATTAWSDVALDGGYSDQAHLVREFRAHAGMTPGEYRRASPRALRHVPVP
ncbi:helix-turn-helix domain-containing protein [Pseudomonas sp. R2.Fl]|nr:helix-turn-helix domain-containing protein [Pseudomonas sp. R2.Fl]